MIHLVLGASGQVGAQLYEHLHGDEICLGTYHRHPAQGLDPLDLRDTQGIARLLRDVRPDVCYVPAAFTHVDLAQTRPDDCYAVNVQAVAHIAQILARRGGLLVLFSTDHVFGESPIPRREDDFVAPQSIYAISKVQAELAVRQALPDRHLIVRTSWVFGPDRQRKNFVYHVWRTLAGGERLTVSSDQFGQPTYAPDLASTTVELARRGARGTFHVVGPTSMTKLAWARLIARTGDLPEGHVDGVTTSPSELVPRPRHVALDRTKLLQLLGDDPIRDPEAGLFGMHEGETDSRPSEEFGTMRV